MTGRFPRGSLFWLAGSVGCLISLVVVLALEVSHSEISIFGGPERHFSPASVHFAIADFDGDWKPDLASVELNSQRRLKADYSIHVQLSAGAELFFGVSAPLGGLRVAARDVNGDNLTDLIVTSVLDESVVAVLLNDGHGQFSRAEPAAYPALAGGHDLFLCGPEGPVSYKLTVATLRYSAGGERATCAADVAVRSTDSVALPGTSVLPVADVHGRRGRSPPPHIFLA